MRILFVMRHSGFVRNFESVIEALATAGHDVHLGFEVHRDETPLADALVARHANVTWGVAPTRGDHWTGLAYRLRSGMDGLLYRRPEYASAPKLRARGFRGMPHWLERATASRAMRAPRVLAALTAVLKRLVAAIPPDAGIERYLDEQHPDRLLVTPLVSGPSQDDVVRSARERGIPTAVCVTSWDNLTNKGLIREHVDEVLVWNPGQIDEAVRLHGVDPRRVTATGAHTFDHWFTWAPRSTRDEFCARVGLPPDRPIVLYLCSSKFIAPDEPRFVRRWLESLRAGPAPLRDAAVLIRPHPATGAWWADVDLQDLGPVSIWPPTGASPQADDTKAEYYDSMHHAAVAVAINTTAIVELSIIGRPVFTVLDADFAETQGGTLHFAHLTGAGGGVLATAGSLPEHLGQVNASLGAPAAPNEAFLRSFVRPHGLDVPATPRMVAAVESLAPTAAPQRLHALDVVLRVLLDPFARRASGAWSRRPAKRDRRSGERKKGAAARARLKARRRRRRRMRKIVRGARVRVGALLGRGPS